jgi:Domain of unkown function (DUF1775)
MIKRATAVAVTTIALVAAAPAAAHVGVKSYSPKRDRIAPGQFQDFPLSVRVPDGAPGTQLVFRAFQTYQRGERVAWTGGPDADEPAPRVTLLAPEEE